MLCMLLRKHLAGGRILSVTQPEEERMLRFAFSATDEMGERVEKALVCELMGRRTNLILLGGDGTVLACFKKVDAEMSPDRPVLPGLKYRMPPRREMTTVPARRRKQRCMTPHGGRWPRTSPTALLPGLLEGLIALFVARADCTARGATCSGWPESWPICRRAPRGDASSRGSCGAAGSPSIFPACPITHLPEALSARRCRSFSALLDLCFAEKARRELQKTVASGLQKDGGQRRRPPGAQAGQPEAGAGRGRGPRKAQARRRPDHRQPARHPAGGAAGAGRRLLH